MLRWATLFFILAVASSICGFYGTDDITTLPGVLMAIAQFIAVIFAVLSIMTLAMAMGLVVLPYRESGRRWNLKPVNLMLKGRRRSTVVKPRIPMGGYAKVIAAR